MSAKWVPEPLFPYTTTSDDPKDHCLHFMENKEVIVKMKDVCARRPIADYIGL